MRRGSTPTYKIKVNLMPNSRRVISSICLAFRQYDASGFGEPRIILYKHIPRDGGGLASNGGYVTLSQDETRLFREGTIERQGIISFKNGTTLSGPVEKELIIDQIHEEDHK